MTTDAPPEKCHWCKRDLPSRCMNTRDMEEQLADDHCASALIIAGGGERGLTTIATIEAARRLSAPAPAAPRVGDDALGVLRDWLALAEASIEQFGVEPHAEERAILARARAALSAPPAASAAEREELEKSADDLLRIMSNRLPDQLTDEMILAGDDILSAGYRKLAPAQSVGQSAAQGVGWQTVARAICAETCAFKGEPACYEVTDNGKPLPWPAPACDEPGCEWLAKRVLSALPKGQEHEG